MGKAKSSIKVSDNSPSTEDPDELQMQDEHDSHWVEAWKDALKQLTELPLPVSPLTRKAGAKLP